MAVNRKFSFIWNKFLYSQNICYICRIVKKDYTTIVLLPTFINSKSLFYEKI